MTFRNFLLSKLQPYRGHIKDVVDFQDETDIINEMLNAHRRWASEYDKISDYFLKSDLYATCEALWEFLKSLPYKVESEELQTVKSPAAILTDDAAGGRDCKHYSLFAAGVLDSLRRKGRLDCDWCFLFASTREHYPTHVLVMVEYPEVIYLDAVEKSFDYERKNFIFTQKVNSMLASVSGLTKIGCDCDTSQSSSSSQNSGYLPIQPGSGDIAFSTGLSNPVTITAPKKAGFTWWEILLLLGGAAGLMYALFSDNKPVVQ